jgi:glucose/arabinose dehydrogenase
MITTRSAGWIRLVALCAAVAACGGGDDAPPAPAPAPAPAPGSDTTPPVVTITAPAQLAAGLANSITFSANATDDVGVANVEFQIDGMALATDTSSPYSATIDSSAHASGQHVLRARASDAVGNQSAWSSVTVQFGGARATPAGFTRNEGFVTGGTLSSATAFTQLPDGRLLVAQQGGALRVVQSNGALLATPMLTLAVDSQGERGLLGVTPHPAFANNGFIYVYYTTTQNSTHNRISRFTVSGNTASGELVLADLPDLGATNHNGGALHFGLDGKLYVAVGENAVPSRAPDINSVFGKLLRFNDDGTIPNDNPFCTTPGNQLCAVWARGLRNPFTFAVRASDGRIHINDVGESAWEEINVGAAGANYGWPSTEGPTSASGITGPLFAYDHDSGADNTAGFFSGCAIIGGAFYPDSGTFPQAFRGSYYFTDLCTPVIGRVDLANGNTAYAFGSVSGSPVGMLAANDGALLVLTQGGIARFTPP